MFFFNIIFILQFFFLFHPVCGELKNNIENTGRGRHRRNNMFPIMAFALTALGMIIVPIGFQFLAVLGGKALLLAKMALLLASINGIKKVIAWYYSKKK